MIKFYKLPGDKPPWLRSLSPPLKMLADPNRVNHETKSDKADYVTHAIFIYTGQVYDFHFIEHI